MKKQHPYLFIAKLAENVKFDENRMYIKDIGVEEELEEFMD